MRFNDPRFIFVCLCWFGMLAILLGSAWEIRERIAGNSLGALHFWVRMVSAICWLAALGLMSFAVMYKWPSPNDEVSKSTFAHFLLSGLCFLLAAMLISIADFAIFWRIRKTHQRYLADQMNQWIQETLEEKNDEPHTEEPRV